MRIWLWLFLITPPAWSQPACPAFTPDKSIPKDRPADHIFRFNGGFVAVVNRVRLDTDGSPISYHPGNKGSTDLCNGLDPIIDGKRITAKSPIEPCATAVKAAIQANWDRSRSPEFCIYGFVAPTTKHPGAKCNAWGGASGSGPIPRQGLGESAPGFFVSTTSVVNPEVKDNNKQARYINSDTIPYVVVPGTLLVANELPRGGVAWAWNEKTKRTATGLFGDTQSQFGEVSIAFAQKLEKGTITPITTAAMNGDGALPWPYGRKNGKVGLTASPSAPVVFVYFSQRPSPALTKFTPEAIEAATVAALQAFGGPDKFTNCLKPLLQP
jgi:hypothetical protein